MFEKTLICLDGSNLAEQVIPYISKSCQGVQTEMILIQIITSNITIPPLQSIHVPPFIKKVEKEPAPVSDIGSSTNLEPEVDAQLSEITREEFEAKRYLEEVAEPLRKSGMSIKTLALQGAVVRILLSYAVKNKVSLIALTTHGKGGLKRGLLGTVAQAILKDSNVPVMVIKPAAPEK
jgi:nucleotide-binding universal stress UspA family protein